MSSKITVEILSDALKTQKTDIVTAIKKVIHAESENRAKMHDDIAIERRAQELSGGVQIRTVSTLTDIGNNGGIVCTNVPVESFAKTVSDWWNEDKKRGPFSEVCTLFFVSSIKKTNKKDPVERYDAVLMFRYNAKNKASSEFRKPASEFMHSDDLKTRVETLGDYCVVKKVSNYRQQRGVAKPRSKKDDDSKEKNGDDDSSSSAEQVAGEIQIEKASEKTATSKKRKAGDDKVEKKEKKAAETSTTKKAKATTNDDDDNDESSSDSSEESESSSSSSSSSSSEEKKKSSKKAKKSSKDAGDE